MNICKLLRALLCVQGVVTFQIIWGEIVIPGHGSFPALGYHPFSGSVGKLPKAPHIRLYLPVSASNTIIRLLPYPSATKTSFVLGYTVTSAGRLRFAVSVLPLLCAE